MQEALRAKGKDFWQATNWVDYQLAPRAIIFRRDTARVDGLSAMKSMMRYNHFREEKVWHVADTSAKHCASTERISFAACLAALLC